jgi:hypothetical protein
MGGPGSGRKKGSGGGGKKLTSRQKDIKRMDSEIRRRKLAIKAAKGGAAYGKSKQVKSGD